MFTLRIGQWYACELIGDEFDWGTDLRSYSPIRIDGLKPLEKGERSFELEFFHWNSLEGVQQKIYRLQILENGKRYILSRSLGHESTRVLLIYDIDREWIHRHFPAVREDSEVFWKWLGRRPVDIPAASEPGTMRVYGLDFTSAPSNKKPLTCAAGSFGNNVLAIEELVKLDGFHGFEELLSSPGPWIMGVDFPFGQPRKLVENLRWPKTWEGYARHVDRMGKEKFETTIRDYTNGREKGDTHHKRAVDRRVNSQSPMKLDFIPVGKMFFQGAPRLAKAPVSIPPVRPTTDNRTVVEAYPALVARQAVGNRSYKVNRATEGAEERKAARTEIVKWIRGKALNERYGFSLRTDENLCTDCIGDDSGDLLDSLLCTIQAAWAYSRRDDGFGIPEECDTLEGWIVDPTA